MEIGSVSSSNVAAYTRSSSEMQSARNAQAEESRQAEQRQTKAKESSEQESPRPVTNAQGQTTGTVVNVTA